jgi:ribosomal protein S18 acetylase RimI-like enzyme
MTHPSAVRIRTAMDADAGPLSTLAERTFRAAFGAANAAADMDLHCARAYGREVQAGEIANRGLVTLVAEEAGELLAYAQLRLGPPPPSVTATRALEILRFYVDEPWHGTGLAQALMTAIVERAAASDCDALWLGVWEHNPRAIRFYGRQGFVEVGEQPFVLGSDPQRDLVMMRILEHEARPGAGTRP